MEGTSRTSPTDPTLGGDADAQSTSQSTTVSELVRQLRAQFNMDTTDERFFEEEQDDGADNLDYYVHAYDNYDDEEGARDFETVSSISRMSALTDVILLSDPHFAGGQILSLEPPQPDEATIDRPMQPPLRSFDHHQDDFNGRFTRPPMQSLVIMGQARDVDPTFETIRYGDGVMKVRRNGPATIETGSTNEPESSGGDIVGTRFPWHRVLLLLVLAVFLGAGAAYIPVLFEDSDSGDVLLQPPKPPKLSMPPNGTVNSESSSHAIESSFDGEIEDRTVRDGDTDFTSQPYLSQVPTQATTHWLTAVPTPAAAAPTTSLPGALSKVPSATPSMAPTPPPVKMVDVVYSILAMADSTNIDLINVQSSPQNLAYAFILETTEFRVHSPQRILQRYAMAVFYFSTGGTSWERKDGWTDVDNECDWYNEDLYPCNSHGELVRLSLRGNNLIGVLPEELGLLKALEEIKLGGNDLVGQLPSTVGRLPKLEKLDLSWTLLDGHIPSELGAASSLKRISLEGTPFSGSIPPSFGALVNLEELLLVKTELTGSMPQGVCDLGAREVWADCDEVACPCCNYCCYEGQVKYCQYVETRH